MGFDTHHACPSHCCPVHGCKYGYDDCPVVTGKTPAERLNEFGCADGMNCDDRGYERAVHKTLRELLEIVEKPLKIHRGYGLYEGIGQDRYECRVCDSHWPFDGTHPKNGCLLLTPMMKHAKEYLAGQRYPPDPYGDPDE